MEDIIIQVESDTGPLLIEVENVGPQGPGGGDGTSRSPQELAADGFTTQVLGYLNEVGGFDESTLTAIAAKQTAGWPDWAIQIRVVGTAVVVLAADASLIGSLLSSAGLIGQLPADASLMESLLSSTSLIGVFAADSGEVGSAMAQGILIGVLVADSSTMGFTASQGGLLSADALAAADSLVTSALENGSLIGVISADNSVIASLASEGALGVGGALSANDTTISSTLDQGALIGVIVADSSTVAIIADAGALTGLLAPANSLIGTTAENGALIGTLAANNSVITSSLGVGGLEASAAAQPVNVSDDFNRADGGIGSNWSIPSSYIAPVISSQRASKTGSTFHHAAYWSTDTFAADQWAIARVYPETLLVDEGVAINTLTAGPSVRMGVTTLGYHVSATNYNDIYGTELTGFTVTLWENGVSTGAYYSSETTNEYTHIKITAVGGTVTVYGGQSASGPWTELIAYTDPSPIASGSAGLVIGGGSYAPLDDWSGGTV